MIREVWKTIGVLFLYAALATAAFAGMSYATSYATKYATPVITIPAYGGQFVPSASADADVLHEILAELKAMRGEMTRLRELAEAPFPQAQGQPGGPRSHLDVLSQSCARCHNVADAEKKGGSFALVDADNRLSPLTPASAVKIYKMVVSGLMPPPGNAPLSPPDKKLILDWIED